jgi:hypothetical protein
MSTTADRPHPNVIFTRLDDKAAALLHLDSKRYYTLNETGATLWSLLEAGSDRDSMAAALGDEFELTIEEARAAVDEFLDDLRRERLLSRE